MNGVILPGATLGVLGSGQLGRMFALAARRMGYRVHTYSPDTDTPTGQVSDVETTAAYEDLDAVARFAKSVAVVTFEFENIPLKSTQAVAPIVAIYPSGEVLHTTQHRLREKTFLSGAGFPVTRFQALRESKDLEPAWKLLGPRAVLKTADFGYDGKGQSMVQSAAELEKAFTALGKRECILEGWVDYTVELSVIAARGRDGQVVVYDVFENHHRNHILDYTLCPARIDPAIQKKAKEMARAVLEKLQVIGVMCVEMFLTKQGELLINELAPRPHNSGHLTIDACMTSQFEQQVRAVCGLPLGSTELIRPAAMANLLGDLWEKSEPNWTAALSSADIKLHLYGKTEPRRGRKMGHLVSVADNPVDAMEKVLKARDRLN
jgi:5-(carboxyamino)imidazole ribonucleotide synthase